MPAPETPHVPATADEELLCCLGPGYPHFAERDPGAGGPYPRSPTASPRWPTVAQGVWIFGSARTPPDHPRYILARTVAARLGARGFDIITGGGPGIMEAANRGAHDAAVRSIGLNIELPHEQLVNPFVDRSLRFRHFFVRKLMFTRYASAFVVFLKRIRHPRRTLRGTDVDPDRENPHFPVVLAGSGTGAAWTPGSAPNSSTRGWCSPEETTNQFI